MRVGELGERWVVNYILERLKRYGETSLPIGDDAAAVEVSGIAVMSVDMSVWTTDAPPGITMRDFGFKSVTSAVSDIAAKGARPTYYLVSLGMMDELEESAFRELWGGIDDAVSAYGGKIIGGDVSKTEEVLVDCAVMGQAKRLVSRSGARVGDVVVVTGTFGAHAAGLRASLMRREGGLYDELRAICFRPKARVLEGPILSEVGLASAMTDSSDGLAVSLYNMARASSVDIEIETLPVHELVEDFAKMEGADVYELVMHGGEEFELVVTLDERRIDVVREALDRVGSEMKVIGRVRSGTGRVYARWRGRLIEVEDRGWSHFG
ncbi:MAG: thiamine-phosphate kinase [Aigarchaeota archaeon]|nr:thiamine-phosphate kinase [Aigarchaeota archaeon]MDW8093301.1 thiamine-phosphate kinase [Nitrososphaerota archaeon]